jgi:hypothetical protein
LATISKEVAWNGIRFLIPSDWEMGRIGSRHLVFEDEAGPVMEAKWGLVKGAFSHQTHLRRLGALHCRKLSDGIQEWPLPVHWRKALAQFQATGFQWLGEADSGRGVILYCPACRKAAILQFLRQNEPTSEQRCLDILASYRDHRPDGHIFWSIFDIQVTLPDGLQLVKYTFDAGKFALEFDDGRQKVRLYRWAPAAALLSGRDLIQFAKTIPEFAEAEPHPLTLNGCPAVDWSVFPAGIVQRRISHLKGKPSFFWLRLWHLKDKNRIMGIWAASKTLLDAPMLNRIARDYKSI